MVEMLPLDHNQQRRSSSNIHVEVLHSEKENDTLKDDVVCHKSQFMRKNLVFANIDEAPEGVHENTEEILREFLEKKMKIAKDLVDNMAFERVYRMGKRYAFRRVYRMGGRYAVKPRRIMARFALFKERELVRMQWKELEFTPNHVYERFPKEVVEKRIRLLPKMKEARNNGKRAWLLYDTLYIDGKPQQEAM